MQVLSRRRPKLANVQVKVVRRRREWSLARLRLFRRAVDVISMALNYASDVVSRKALAAGFTGENVTAIRRWLAPFRSM